MNFTAIATPNFFTAIQSHLAGLLQRRPDWLWQTENNWGGIVMSEQVLVQFEIDKKLQEEVTEIYRTLGMDLTTALRKNVCDSQ